MYILQDIIDRGFSPLDLRFFFFMAQYGNFQNFTRDALQQAQKTRANWIKRLSNHTDLVDLHSPVSYQDFAKDLDEIGKQFLEQLIQALADDLNAPKFFALIAAADKDQESVLQVLSRLDQHLLKLELFQAIEEASLEIPAEITQLANQRLQAKADQNYVLADQLRSEIKSQGREIKDLPDRYELSPL